MNIKLCHKPIVTRSKFDQLITRRCYLEDGHTGPCCEYPYLKNLNSTSKRVSDKIRRDATMTTGASWKSEDAGPNRTPRWVAQDAAKKATNPLIKAKLIEKSASYEDCMDVAAKLTWFAYQMINAPPVPLQTKNYLESRFGTMTNNSTRCIICRNNLDFNDFSKAGRGRALIETAHANPREHNETNVGFAHRDCNIAQGNRSLDDFYQWINGIICRVNNNVLP